MPFLGQKDNKGQSGTTEYVYVNVQLRRPQVTISKARFTRCRFYRFFSHFWNISNRSHNRRIGNLLDLSGDPVEVPPALAGQPPAAVRRVLLHPLERLEGLEALARHRAGSGAPVAGLGAVVPADWNSDERCKSSFSQQEIKSWVKFTLNTVH